MSPAGFNTDAGFNTGAGFNTVEALHRTLDQELVAILRRASLECPVCGEFLLHRADGIGCAQCGLEIDGEAAGGGLERSGEAQQAALPFPVQAG